MVSAPTVFACGLATCASVATATAADTPGAPATRSNQSIGTTSATATTTDSHSNNIIEANGYLVYNKCHAWDSYNWDNAKYVCAWWHDTDYGSYANLFIKRYDGGFDKDCWCKEDMASAAAVRAEFDAVSGCGDIQIHYYNPPDPHH
ncbi:hypothetical protein Gpo141_00013352 [Globisporangium polare]